MAKSSSTPLGEMPCSRHNRFQNSKPTTGRIEQNRMKRWVLLLWSVRHGGVAILEADFYSLWLPHWPNCNVIISLGIVASYLWHFRYYCIDFKALRFGMVNSHNCLDVVVVRRFEFVAHLDIFSDLFQFFVPVTQLSIKTAQMGAFKFANTETTCI